MNTFKTLYPKYKELINYLIVGGLTTVVSLGVYYGCVLTQSDRRLTRYIFEMQREFLKKQKASEGR